VLRGEFPENEGEKGGTSRGFNGGGEHSKKCLQKLKKPKSKKNRRIGTVRPQGLENWGGGGGRKLKELRDGQKNTQASFSTIASRAGPSGGKKFCHKLVKGEKVKNRDPQSASK